MRRHTLLIDADDTLWENNVFFERVIEDFISLVEPLGYARDYTRRILNETERRNIRQHGYGVRSFGRPLAGTYLKLAGHKAKRNTGEQRARMVREPESPPPKMVAGGPETLAHTSMSHRPFPPPKG